MKRSRLAFALCALAAAHLRGADSDDWRAQVGKEPAGNFSPLPDVRMHFTFGWSNVLKAAQADATIQHRGGDYRAVVAGRTEGLARALWLLDAQHTALVGASPLRPKRIAQIENYRKRTIETQVRYDAAGLDRLRTTAPPRDKPRWKRIDFSPVYDVIGGILYVRSQPLRVGDRVGLVCFPGDSPYLVVVAVQGREPVRCMGRSIPALKLSLKVLKLEVKDRTPVKAVRYEKFRGGTIWVSDDALRLPLRAEVNVFIGYVYGELSGYELLAAAPAGSRPAAKAAP